MEDCKQIILVRTALKLGKGKLAVQISHGAVNAANIAQRKNPEWYRNWSTYGQTKIAVKVSSLETLLEYKKKAEKLKLPNSLIEDAGRTQIESGTTTCLAIGPAPKKIIDPLTKDLKLL